jgi:septum site-determining protein MinD
MTATIVTITSGKGGVGKTTVTANLGVALACYKQRVACVDADIGLRNLDIIMGLENTLGYDLVDVVEGRCKLHQAMIQDQRQDNLYLIPAAQKRDKTATSPQDMIRLMEELRPNFDWLVIDSPAGIERGFRNALAPADLVLIITNPDISAVRDADRILGLLRSDPKKPRKLILNRVIPRLVRRGDMLTVDAILDALAIDLLGVIPDDETVLIASNQGKPSALDPISRTGRAFHNMARRLLGEEVPFESLEYKDGLFQRISRFLQPGGAK